MPLLRQLPDTVLREESSTLCKKFKTAKRLLSADPTQFAPLAYKEVKALKLRVARTCAPFALSGLQVYKDFVREASVIPTGSVGMDLLLGGGLPTGQIVEVFGRSGTGKSEFCHRLAANVSLNLKKTVLYLQTKGDFRPDRIELIVRQAAPNAEEQDITNALKSILVVNVGSLDELLASLSSVSTYSPRVLVIDSMAALVQGRLDATVGTLARLQTLGYSLKRVAADHLSVVLVNHQVESLDGDPKAAMGTSWQTVPNIRIRMDRNFNSWSAALVKSSSLALRSVEINY